jgi:hypothetical protein
MPVLTFPSPTDAVVASSIVLSVTLEGGAPASSGLASFDGLFIDGSVFDGGQP